MRFSAFVVFFISFLFVNCSRQTDSPALFALLPAEHTGIDFSNLLFPSEELNIITFEYFYNGAGVAVGDIDNDGLQDVFFAANMTNSRLYRNKGKLQFEDITAQAGIDTEGRWATGVAMVDINGDGWLDIYVCFAGPYGPTQRANQFYINNGDGTFTERAAELGLADTGHTTHAAFFDYDGDGDLDVYLLTNVMEEVGPNVIRPKKLDGESPNTDRLYRNDGGRFVNVSREAGILAEGYGLGLAIADFNEDGWPDIYVSNDYLSNDLLYINNQDGTFTDRADAYFRHTSYSAMGNDAADFNNDGRIDIVTVDMLPPDHQRRKLMFPSVNYDRFRSEMRSGYAPQYPRNTLQLNNGPTPDGGLAFSEIGQLAGMQSTDWSWSALLADVDNDGWKDLLITNGYPRDITNLDFVDFKMNELLRNQYSNTMQTSFVAAINSIDGAYLPNFAFKNKGNLTFEHCTRAWGFTQPCYSHGAVLADLDNDGDLDFIVNNVTDPAFILENRSEQWAARNYLRLKLAGVPENPAGFGAKVWLHAGAQMQFQELSPYRGYQSCTEPILHFGLRDFAYADSLRIVWPDGRAQVLHNIPANQVLTLRHTDAVPYTLAAAAPRSLLFQEVSKLLNIDYQHIEEHYADFKVQPLLPHKHSEEGPPIAVGDMNGDGLEDFFVGGSFKHSGVLWFQQSDGTFRSRLLSTGDNYEEDLGCLLFDADGDGDLDLYVSSGSSEFPDGSPYLQDRLYKNDGKGNFQLDTAALPPMRTGTACVVAADYDGDGDLDLFVGGRIVAGNYAAVPRSYLLENQGGRFTIATNRVCPELEYIGRVTSAVWADFNQDGQPDLALAGEWMPIVVLQNTNGRLKQMTEGQIALENSVGWWNALAVADLDGDGDLDLVAGNLGWNAPYRADSDQPVRLYIADFEGNGQPKAVMTHYLQNREAPVHFRNDLLNWLFPLKKQFRDYASYAQASWQEIYPPFTLKQAQVLEAQTFSTSWIENRNGIFVLQPLPVEAQLAPIQSVLLEDFNGNGHVDILLSGNHYAPEPHTGRHDAFNGLYLQGIGHSKFQPLPFAESGFYLPGDARALASLRHVSGRRLVLATRNSDTLQAFFY